MRRASGRAGCPGVRRPDAGFTLVELLVAVSLLALLTTILLTGLRPIARAVDLQSSRLDRATRVALVQNVLRGELADARLLAEPGRTLPGAPRGLSFSGLPDRLDFVTPAAESVAFGGLQAVSLALVPGSAGAPGTLRLRWVPYRTPPTDRPGDRPGDRPADRGDDGDGSGGGSHETLLLDHVERAGFSYFGASDPDEAPSWHGSWRGGDSLPLLVRLAVVFSDGPAMPDLVVALRLAPPLSPPRDEQP